MISTNLTDAGDGRQAKLGQVINTRLKTIPTVSNFSSTPDNYVATDVPVTLSQHKQLYHQFVPSEFNGTDRDLIEEVAPGMAVAIANNLADAVAALWLIATYTNATTVASGWTYANTVLPIRAALNTRGIAEIGRFLMVNSTVAQALLADPLIVGNQNNPAQGGAIASGQLPGTAGLSIFEFPALPATGTMVGFAGHPDTCALAVRAPSNPGDLIPGAPNNMDFEIITEPKHGLSIASSQWVDPATQSANWRLNFMYGVAAGNAPAGQILKTT